MISAGRRAATGPGWPGVARARCRALLTEATVVSSSSATSVACQRSTSRRISTARCRAGRCWRAVTNASRIDSLASASSSGLPSGGRTRSSGIGVTQRFSASWGPISPSAEWDGPMSIGRARRWRPRSMSRQTLVAIRYSHDCTDERPSNCRPSSRPGRSSPGRHRRPRRPSPASGSSIRSAAGGTPRSPPARSSSVPAVWGRMATAAQPTDTECLLRPGAVSG